MKNETLEALLIDQALGQLSPDTEELLSEYLASHAEAADSAAEWRQTVVLAAQLLKTPGRQLVLPPRKFTLLSRGRPRRLWALAASFVAGAGFALLGLRGGAPSETAPLDLPRTQVAAAPPIPPVRSAASEPDVRTMPFWSTERAIAVATAKQVNPASR
jgi:anti-sigma factor RsiW